MENKFFVYLILNKNNTSYVGYTNNLKERLKKQIQLLNFLKKLIEHKIKRLNQSKCILELKYTKYKRCHNFWNISTIIYFI